MKVGDLVQYWNRRDDSILGVVVGEWTHDDSGEEHTLVRWITGRHVGDTDAILPRYLEALCK